MLFLVFAPGFCTYVGQISLLVICPVYNILIVLSFYNFINLLGLILNFLFDCWLSLCFLVLRIICILCWWLFFLQKFCRSISFHFRLFLHHKILVNDQYLHFCRFSDRQAYGVNPTKKLQRSSIILFSF